MGQKLQVFMDCNSTELVRVVIITGYIDPLLGRNEAMQLQSQVCYQVTV